MRNVFNRASESRQRPRQHEEPWSSSWLALALKYNTPSRTWYEIYYFVPCAPKVSLVDVVLRAKSWLCSTSAGKTLSVRKINFPQVIEWYFFYAVYRKLAESVCSEQNSIFRIKWGKGYFNARATRPLKYVPRVIRTI